VSIKITFAINLSSGEFTQNENENETETETEPPD
jgi:hypothetical protein